MVDTARSALDLRRRRRARRTFVGLALGFVVASVFAVPEIMLAQGTKRARLCLASYEAPRGPEAPRCGGELEWFLFPARVPWTSNRARYRAEELGARIAKLDYLDATVGAPSEEKQAAASEAIARHEQIIKDGSQRIAIDDLGRSMGSPDEGRDADELGDRRTLLKRGDYWLDWRVRLDTLRAGLLVGDMKRTDELAKRYADYDPRDQDVRTALAAFFCLGDDAVRGFDMLPLVQDDRASRKYEGMSRDFGEVRSLIVACAARAKKEPPPLPTNPNAGSADAVEARTLLRIRLAGARGGESLDAARAAVRSLLDGGPRNPGARVALLAALIEADPAISAEDVARLARPTDGEEPIGMPVASTAIEWLSERRPALGDADPAPIALGSTFTAAARVTRSLEEIKDVAPDITRELTSLRGTFSLEAASAYARAGDIDAGLSAADEAASLLHLGLEARGLLRSNVYWLGGDRDHAFSELDSITRLARDETSKENPLLARVSATAAIQRAELALSRDSRDEALASAKRALELARAENLPLLEARALWLLASLGEVETVVPSYDDLASGNAFSWIGLANPLSPYLSCTTAERGALFQRALAPWVGLSAADAPLRRAARFALLRDRGDVPPWLSLHALLASKLLTPAEGDVEVFLDALLAFDARRFSLRSYAFARAEAARMRGDSKNAALWDERYRSLRTIAMDPARLDLARHLDL